MHRKLIMSGLSAAPARRGFVLASALPLCIASAGAMELSFSDGAVGGRFDNTISYGIAARLADADEDFAAIAVADPGTGANMPYRQLSLRNARTQVNKNDGNLNFKDAGQIVSNTVKLNTTLELTYEKYGAQVSGFAFYDAALDAVSDNLSSDLDFINDVDANDRFTSKRLPGATEDYAVTDVRLSSAYVWGDFEVGSRTLNVRVGEQVLSWGEALFLQDGINQANPADLSALRLPGAEIKDALLPLPMLVMSTSLSDSLSMEAFYEFGWTESEADPVGTFYSTTDAFFGRGAEAVIIETEDVTNGGDSTSTGTEDLARIYNSIVRGIPYDQAAGVGLHDPMGTRLSTNKLADVTPPDDGQFGFAFRYMAESLNNTEFGFYFLNTHARKATAGAVLGEALGTATDAETCAAANEKLGQIGINAACTDMPGILGGSQGANAQRIVAGMNALHYLDTSSYFLEYQENIQTYGFTFSSNIGETSLSGEIAYRPEMPFLPEVGDNLIALNSINARYLGNNQVIVDGGFGEHITQNTVVVDANSVGLSAGDTVRLMAESEAVNFSLLGIHNLGPMFFADGLTVVAEIGGAWLGDLDSSKKYAAESALGVARSCNSDGGSATAANNPTSAAVCSMANVEVATIDLDTNGDGLPDADARALVEGNDDHYLDAFSWGYRLVVAAEFNDVVAGLNLKPQYRFAHDVGGNSVVGGNFVEGRMSSTIALEAEYLGNWNFGAGANFFWGAEDRNQLQDRDSIYANVKYSF
jgi:hypothetical protein